jgi:hypothetical protein
VSLTLLSCSGGRIVLPDRDLVLVSREDGGSLIVDPPRQVWERSELTGAELSRWSALVAAAGRAMLDTLPQLHGGCINYWEAGNWALHDEALPTGPKLAETHRRVHLHLLGRSRTASHPAWRWGEAPQFPRFADRHAWASQFERLTPTECRAIVQRVMTILADTYAFDAREIAPSSPCAVCGYPMTTRPGLL